MLRQAAAMLCCTTMLATLHAQPAETPTPAAEPAAQPSETQTFMAKVLARYQAAKSYSHEAVTSYDIKFGGDMGDMLEVPEPTRASFHFVAPGRFALTGGDVLDVYADGENLTAYNLDTKKYATVDAQGKPSLRELPGMFGMYMPLEFPIVSVILDAPDSFETSALSVKSWGEITEAAFNDHPGHRVACRIAGTMPGMGDSDASIWVDDSTGLIGEIEFDLLEQFKAMAGQGMNGPVPEVAKRVVEFQKVTLDEPIADDLLAFVPADDAVKADAVPSLEEIMAARFGEDLGAGGVEADAGPDLGTPAPVFSAKTIDGKQVTLADLKGKVVLIDFWATWCGPCVRSIPTIQALHEKYADKGLVIIGISLDDPGDADKLPGFAKEHGITYLLIHDTNGTIARSYGVSPIPHSVLIAKDGTVQANHIGFMPGMDQQYNEEIDKLLEGKPLADG